MVSAAEAERKIAHSTVTVEAPSALANAKLPDGTPALKFELDDRVVRVLGVPRNYGIDDVRYLFRGFDADSCAVVACPDAPTEGSDDHNGAQSGGQSGGQNGGQSGPKKGGKKKGSYPHATYLVQFQGHEDQQMAMVRVNNMAMGGGTVKLVPYK